MVAYLTICSFDWNRLKCNNVSKCIIPPGRTFAAILWMIVREKTHTHTYITINNQKRWYFQRVTVSNTIKQYQKVSPFCITFFFLFSLVMYSTQHIQNWKRTVSCACLQENAPLFQVCVYCYRNKTVPTK